MSPLGGGFLLRVEVPVMAKYVVQNLDYVVGDDEDFDMTITRNGSPVNLTGATVEAQVREDYADTATAVVATATCTLTDAVNGQFTMSLSAAQTTSMPAWVRGQRKTYVYDVQVTVGGKRKTYGSGQMIGWRQVTDT